MCHEQPNVISLLDLLLDAENNVMECKQCSREAQLHTEAPVRHSMRDLDCFFFLLICGLWSRAIVCCYVYML